MSKEDKAIRYVQDAMFSHIVNAVRIEEPCFTKEDLRKAYESGYNEGYTEGRKDTLIDQLKKNKDEEARLSCERKQAEAWDEFKRNYLRMIDNSINIKQL